MGAVFASYWLGVSSPLAHGARGRARRWSGAGRCCSRWPGGGPTRWRCCWPGLAVSLAAGAATSLLLALAPSPFAFYDAFDWLMGSFTDRSLGQAAAALIPAAIACALLLRRARALDLLALGDDVARLARPQAAAAGRSRSSACSAIAVGACVSVCGAIGFVGLIAPVIARRLTAGHPGRALVPAGLIGGGLVLGADLAVRAIPLDRAIPVGVVTTLIGTPFFIAVLMSMRGRMAS